MTLTITLSPEEEQRLAAAARARGVPPQECARELLSKYLPPPPPDDETTDPMLALFAQWAEEDANMTPEEIAEEDRDWEEFKKNINAERDRAGARRIF